VDAPWWWNDPSGQRECERQVWQWCGRWRVSANSTNLASRHLAGVRLRQLLEQDGCARATAVVVAHRLPGRGRRDRGPGMAAGVWVDPSTPGWSDQTPPVAAGWSLPLASGASGRGDVDGAWSLLQVSRQSVRVRRGQGSTDNFLTPEVLNRPHDRALRLRYGGMSAAPLSPRRPRVGSLRLAAQPAAFTPWDAILARPCC